jgi:hypothetical protein
MCRDGGSRRGIGAQVAHRTLGRHPAPLSHHDGSVMFIQNCDHGLTGTLDGHNQTIASFDWQSQSPQDFCWAGSVISRTSGIAVSNFANVERESGGL